jgi:LacI family transcriptional regulator
VGGSQRRVTLKQIADRAGCSVTAVSKALNGARGSASVGPETQSRVLRIAAELGYTPNYLARALQRGRTDTLGLVCQFGEAGLHHNDFWAPLIQGIQGRARQAQQDVLIIGADRGHDEVQRGLEQLRQRRFDALIVPALMYGFHLPDLEAADGPIVYAATTRSGAHPAVGTDEAPGIVAACRHLADLGHRRLLWLPTTVGGALLDPARDAAVRAAAASQGLALSVRAVDEDQIADRHGTAGYIAGCRAQLADLAADAGDVTAVMAYSERVALALCAEVNAAGRRVPDDLSVIGFDDLHAHIAQPPLTVVSQRLRAVGERAAELALELAHGSRPAADYAGRVELLPSKLVVRVSTGPPPARG